MISLLPGHHETIVLPRKAADFRELLASATSNKPFIQTDEKQLLFNGWVRQEKFRISLRITRPNHYVPLVIGRIESSSSGSILMIDYKLFPTTRILMTLWTILLILGGLFVSLQSQNIAFLLAAAGIISLIQFIVWSNFRLQLKPTRQKLHTLLSATHEREI